MRAVVQRVRSARVSARPAGSAEGVAREVVAEMAHGLLCLVAAAPADSREHAELLARKLVHLRVFADERGRMNLSLLDVGGALGIVSQFTLYGSLKKGRRPYFGDAAPPELAEPLVEELAAAARAEGVEVVCGRFGADMEVALVNAGPVTLILDTDDWIGGAGG